jgi:microsomal dipeptidase-like Zn-dependent dipeptidase
MTHVENNAFADSSTSNVGPVHGGLSSLGEAAIKEMNRIGRCLFHVLRVSRSLQNDY